MGRAKQYERSQLLDRAISLFRRQGFHGTTTAQLVAALEVNRKSMYAEFGSKQGLFEAALAHYDDHHVSWILRRIEATDAGLDDIEAAFSVCTEATETGGAGCLMCHTAVDRGALPEGSQRFVDAYLARLTQGFRHALTQGRQAGELSSDADVDALADFFTVSRMGAAACMRASADPHQIRRACQVAITVLRSHRIPPR